MFALWPGDWLNFSIFIKTTFGFVGQDAASEAGHIANTNVVRKALDDTNENKMRIVFKILLRLTVIIVLGLTILLNFKIYERVDKIHNKYSKFYDALTEDKSYQQIPTNIQIDMESTEMNIIMLDSVSADGTFVFGLLIGLCIILILIDSVLEIKKDLLKT